VSRVFSKHLSLSRFCGVGSRNHQSGALSTESVRFPVYESAQKNIRGIKQLG
jgi:hypothetical protein